MDTLPSELIEIVLNYLNISDLVVMLDFYPAIVKDIIQKRLQYETVKEIIDLLNLCVDPYEVAYYLAEKMPNHERELEMLAVKGIEALLSYIRNIPESFDILCKTLELTCQQFLSHELTTRFHNKLIKMRVYNF